MEKEKRKKKLERYEKLAKKSIIFKPLVFRNLYKYSAKIRKDGINNHIKKFTNEGNLTKKERSYLRRDMAYSKVVYNILYTEYFVYGFRNKNHRIRKSFIANPNRQDYFYLLGTPEGQAILRDKEKAYNVLKKYYKRELIKIENEKDYEKFGKYIKKYPVFVKKPVDASFGNGIELIDSSKYKNSKTLFNSLLSEGTFIMEEYIKSDPKMASLHPESLNTVRIVTYKDENNNVHIHHPFIKIGQGKSFVDNGGSGGMFALIDPDTGILITDGKDELNNVYEYHPDTNVKIKGFQIPNWDEAVEIAKQAALDFPYTRYIGWDVALTIDKGPVIVEGNGKTQFFGQQMTDEIGKRKSMEKLIDYKNLKKKMKDVERWELPPVKYNKENNNTNK